jgi:hypothetical protein
MDTSATEISLLTSEADLTIVHEQSDLPFTHNSRHTTTGFQVDGPLLHDYVPTPPSKTPPSSWVWKHGEHITRKKDGVRLFLCRICYDKPSGRSLKIIAQHTTRIIRHLTDAHAFDKDGNRRETITEARNSRQSDMVTMLKRQAEAQTSSFDRSDFQNILLSWIVGDDISLRSSCSKRLRTLVTYRNPILANALPTCHQTSRQWIVQASRAAKEAIRRDLSKAKSRITLSFDGWKSGNELDLLGVVGHYIDDRYCVKNVLLALRNTYGSHSGEALHEHLVAVCREYQISNKIAFFMADNASPNDTAIELLESELPIDAIASRLRCTAHIINLVTKAILYGTDIDCINNVIRNAEGDLNDSSVSRFEAVLRSQDEQAVLKAWRKKGPVGKLHNIVLHARATPSRRAFFQSKQKEAEPDKRLYQLVFNGGIRWNSTCDMIERAIKLKDALELYSNEYKHDLEDDLLSGDDWLELKDILDLLLPLKHCSKAVQNSGKLEDQYHHGCLFESLQAIDFLLTKLERLKNEHLHRPNTHFKACINLGWKKLNKYYTLSDDTAAYRAAIALHPSFKMQWFKEKWSSFHPDWIDDARIAVKELYNQYKRQHGDEAAIAAIRPQELDKLSEFERYNILQEDQFNGNELERYFSEDRAPPTTNPLTWWRLNQERYPVLKHMAFDLLAAPASSSADERQFSMAGHVLDEEHFNTLDDLAEAYQCLKSAYSENIHVKIAQVLEEPSSTSQAIDIDPL